ncbi:MAG: C39 family peptidase [Bacilli bacterium]|nr:C39 family peptidase [Bacilli bacterium]
MRYLYSVLLFIVVVLLCAYIKVTLSYTESLKELNIKTEELSYKEYINIKEEEVKNIVNNIKVKTNKELTTYEEVIKYEEELNIKYNEEYQKNSKYTQELNTKTKQYNTLKVKYDNLVKEEEKKSKYMIPGVPKINQYSLGYPTGCESAALTVLLKYHGIKVDMKSVVKKLKKEKLPYSKNGKLYGGDPEIGFIGNPATNYSYGVYDKPIEDVANTFKSGIINGRGMSFSKVLELVKENRPVLVWTSGNLKVPYVSSTWIHEPTGKKIKWLSGEHALVVIGYTKNQVIVSDSLTGTVRYFNKKTFENRYNFFGKRALYY